MFNPLLEIYAAALQREREEEVLRLSEATRLLRKSKAGSPSQLEINLKRLLTVFERESVQQGKIVSTALQASLDCCSTNKFINANHADPIT